MMFMGAIRERSVMVIFLLFLPGCRGYINWGGCPWHHSERAIREIEEGHSFAKSVAIFDKYSTRAIFDALPLADQVRAAYARLVDEHYGKSEKWLPEEVAEQVALNEDRISFYVLALREMPFGDQCGIWVPRLIFGDLTYAPIYIKRVDPPLEYKHILGALYTRFKVIYEIAFNARDENSKPIIPVGARSVMLQFKSPDKEASISWDFGAQGITFGTADVDSLAEKE